MSKLAKAKQAAGYLKKDAAGRREAKKFSDTAKPIWLISERGIDAQDNGFAFFKYMVENNSEAVDSYYVIDAASPDYPKVQRISDNIVQPGSRKHYAMMYAAQALISTHAFGYTPDMAIYYRLAQFGLFKPKGISVFLQHGLLDKETTWLSRKTFKPDLFEVCARPELRYVQEGLCQPLADIMPSGQCRYDTLDASDTKNEILIFPTWRIYLRDFDLEEFKKSRYFQFYQSLIAEKAWKDLPDGWRVIFCLHPEMQKFSSCFTTEKPVYIEPHPDIGALVRSNALLITDYSSVYFDEIYQRKPIIFTQFDAEEYKTKHYQGIFIDPARYGMMCASPHATAEKAVGIIKNGYTSAGADELFLHHDVKNCQRTYYAILKKIYGSRLKK